MATQTTNLGLIKPAGTDYVLVSDFNSNADTLDGAIGDLTALETTEKTSLVGAINDVLNSASATVNVGTTTTGNPGTSASVTNSGTSKDAVFNFTIPRGEDGAPGVSVTVGTTTTGAPGTSASVTNSGTASNPILNFTIPQGAAGAGKISSVNGQTDVVVLDAADVGAVALSTYNAHTILAATTDDTPAALTVGEQTVVGRTTGGNIAALSIDSDLSSVSENDDTIPSAKATKAALDAKVPNSLFDANSILAATTDNTPAAVTVAEQTVVCRLTGGAIDDIAIGIADNNIVQMDDASAASAEYARFTANGIEGRTTAEVLTDIGAQAKQTITTNANASPALGTVANNNEYRCTNTSLTAAPTLTVASIASTSTEFACVVVFKAPNATAPVVTNNSGYTLKYKGDAVSSGTYTPVSGTVYRLSFLFDGIYLNCYVVGVA